MCGRFAFGSPKNTAGPFGPVHEWFEFDEFPLFESRFNIAPAQPVAIIRKDERARSQFTHVLWGLIPSWAKDPDNHHRPINARCETAAEKPTFRNALRYRRCLVPANFFYEWKRYDKSRQPYAICMADEQPFAMAGLWEHWQGADGSEIETCAILTCRANEMMKQIHDRMPVILHRDDYGRWLDTDIQHAEKVQDLLTPFPADQMDCYPVTQHVNSVKNEDERCLAREENTEFLF